MIRYTTPTITLNVSVDLSQATNIIVTIKQGNVFLKKENQTYSQGKILVDLTESESAAFRENSTAKVQVNWLYLDNGVEKTQKEVADTIGISQSYISRLEKKIIVQLREELKDLIYS